MDIQQSNDGQLRELALFAGAGGGILGGKLLGWRTVAAVERDAYAAAVLAQRQNDGILNPFPIWSDISTFDGQIWRGHVDVISGGFPCQDISSAGKGAGIEGERSGLWKEMARVIREVRPRFAYVENSPILTSRGLGVVLGDLASMGYDAEWGVLLAGDVGANHKRKRIWILAYSNSNRPQGAAIKRSSQEKGGRVIKRGSPSRAIGEKWGVWDIEPNVGRVAHGVAFGMDRLKAIGNGQVPLVAAIAFKNLKERTHDNH